MLSEILQLISGGENIEVFDIKSHQSYNPKAEKLPHNGAEYIVYNIYADYDKDKRDTLIIIEALWKGDAKVAWYYKWCL